MSAAPFAVTVLALCAGIGVWALHFAAIYGATALACARDLPQAVLPAVVVATLAAAAALVAVVTRAWPRRAAFEHWLGAALAALALVAVLWEAIPVLLVPPCG